MALNIAAEIDEETLKTLVANYLAEKGFSDISAADVVIQVKSIRNYKSEWEVAAFKATICKTIK